VNGEVAALDGNGTVPLARSTRSPYVVSVEIDAAGWLTVTASVPADATPATINDAMRAIGVEVRRVRFRLGALAERATGASEDADAD